MGERIIFYSSCILSTHAAYYKTSQSPWAYYEIAGNVGVRIRKEDEESMNHRRVYGTKKI